MTVSTQCNFKSHLTQLLRQSAQKILSSDEKLNIELARPKQVDHGDYSSNLAMQLARQMRKNPRDIAMILIDALPDSPFLEKAEVAGNGFINLFLKVSAKQQCLPTILQQGDQFGHNQLGKGQKIQIEFVSANPTGPLHVGHGRGAAYGASLANIMVANGYSVTREYYVNDAGRQMDILALSTWLRYLELCGFVFSFPENAYQGKYVIAMAKLIHEAHGHRYVHQTDSILLALAQVDTPLDADEQLDRLIAIAKETLGEDYAYIHNFALTEQLGDCRNDLMEFGVEFDTWFSEQSLFDSGMVARAIQLLDQRHALYQQDGATWFRSTRFGDEKDRVVQRENGQYTYFASDIAYHLNKYERQFSHIINVWGADHHGYIPRVKGAVSALGFDSEVLEIALVQFAILYRDGKKVSMSTRSGEFVSLRELRQEVGNDAARFFYVLRKSDQHLDFDLNLAKSQSNENPVYYVQYAHARICSVLTQWGEDETELQIVDTHLLISPAELILLQKLIDYPDTLEAAARERAPHLLAFYLKDLASEFHSYYNSTRFLVLEQPLKLARLALIAAIKQVLANGLKLLGVSAPSKM
ncbi:Arginine--tRNA ligase [Nitrosomonas nitrosa]|jgi:arginyl-tRNA synthetase|uniref:Arginine--tRNA ligase n=1 Tax=Nitrosomonas nitrosa TaxID=52442 RepID=A0A8H9DC45_9PROT|nr:arginine--tRNA ligase [Nitrosomonas nitrosa]MCO6432706.1 arginine--tRNA ligase [Nitrosomonas nitrosa]CAE6512481.1 Arginine--tRNA ligase [Nitrosomonas nitrosa]